MTPTSRNFPRPTSRGIVALRELDRGEPALDVVMNWQQLLKGQ